MVVLAVSRGTLSSTVFWGLISLPVLALCLALGQGMVVASYLAVRDAVPDPTGLSTRALGGRSAVLWLSLLALVMVGPGAVSVALLRPAFVGEGGLPSSAPVLLELAATDEVREVYLPDTALRLAVSERAVRVLASDGGGAGTLPLTATRIKLVRVDSLAASPG